MHINEHRFPGKQVCVYIYRLVKQYAPSYMVPKRSVDNPKGNYTFSKEICKSFLNTFTRHNSGMDEVY